MIKKCKNTVALAVVFLISIVCLIGSVIENKNDEKAFDLLYEQVNQQSSNNDVQAEQDTDVQKEDAAPIILPQYEKLYEENSDMAGWVEIEGTKLSYPVMYTPNDVEFYLRRAFNKTDSIAGTPFVGYDCVLEPRSDNLLLYGHNMKNGAMFTTILSYKDRAFWEKHPIIQFDTLYEQGQYEIMSAFYVTASVGNGHFEFYNFTNAENEEAFNEFVETSKQLSLYNTGVTAAYGDHLLTLTTCSYHSENGRFVVIARKQ